MITKEFLSEKEVAQLTGLAVSTLRNWRAQGKPPSYVKVGGGRAVRYPKEAVMAFMQAGLVQPRDPGPLAA